jgi:D-beta-D-heptose 7-phosphate kinase/D-beta-D-heptose 1-phosphate adenosyltransferase
VKVLVLGDMIHDVYRHFTASRLCPEGPVPVLVGEKKYSSSGGAGLVTAQLVELMGDSSSVILLTGSYSQKERVFADDRLMLRMDSDSEQVVGSVLYQEAIEIQLRESKPDAVIVSDYDKGSFTYELGHWLIKKTDELGIPVFVDAKKNWFFFCGCFAMFPNKTEKESSYEFVTKHVIQKLGADGCEVDGVHIPTKKHAVRDVTGAGDVFLAAFVYEFLSNRPCFTEPIDEGLQQFGFEKCARFANKVAGISVEYVGTHIVTREELDK